MRIFKFKSLSRKLGSLVILAVIPALIILFYSGLEMRQQFVNDAAQKVLQLVHTMAHNQQEIAQSTKQMLSTLTLLPEIKSLNTQKSENIFQAILANNTIYHNISLADRNGNVLASGRHLTQTNIADRQHFTQALENKDFSAGEYIISRIGSQVSAFAFSYPLLDAKGIPIAILSAVINLTNFSDYLDIVDFPDDSFIAITDRNGIRLYYYPPQTSTNPIGKPIKSNNWEKARSAVEPGFFISRGSDGISRIFAFEQIRITPKSEPYLYVWAAIPKSHVLGAANSVTIRNLLLMIGATLISLYIAWIIGRNTESLIVSLEKASNEIKTLRGILPICSYCKKIRNDEGYYEQIEGYIHKHSEVDFSHTICPECLKEHHPKEFSKIIN